MNKRQFKKIADGWALVHHDHEWHFVKEDIAGYKWCAVLVVRGKRLECCLGHTREAALENSLRWLKWTR